MCRGRMNAAAEGVDAANVTRHVRGGYGRWSVVWTLFCTTDHRANSSARSGRTFRHIGNFSCNLRIPQDAQAPPVTLCVRDGPRLSGNIRFQGQTRTRGGTLVTGWAPCITTGRRLGLPVPGTLRNSRLSRAGRAAEGGGQAGAGRREELLPAEGARVLREQTGQGAPGGG